MVNKREFTTILHDPKSVMRRLLKTWGSIPLLLMLEIDWERGPLVLVGTADRMMWPLLPPGSLLQLDQTVRGVDHDSFSEFERPIYLIEHRNKFHCCHALRRRDRISLISHGESQPSFSVSLTQANVRGRVTPIFRPLATRDAHKRHK